VTEIMSSPSSLAFSFAFLRRSTATAASATWTAWMRDYQLDHSPSSARRACPTRHTRPRRESNPLPMANLEGGVVPQRALGTRRKTKLRGELSEAAGYTNELICVRARPAQVVYGFGPDAVQVHKPHEEGAVRIKQAREMRLVEPRRVLSDLPHDPADTLVALADGA
jgi:hypothetical protein